jgi:hypothetical protein
VDKETIIKAILHELAAGEIRETQFPMLSQYGMLDFSESIHSTGLNYITQIGRSLNGVVALSEYPIYNSNGEFSIKITREIRPDSVWFDKSSRRPLLIAEFERYENNLAKNIKLQKKIQNLLLGYHQLGGFLPVILLIYWTYHDGTIVKDIDQYLRILDEGFAFNKNKWIPGINASATDYLVYQTVAFGNQDCLKFKQWIRVR